LLYSPFVTHDFHLARALLHLTDQTGPDQTGPDQTGPDQTKQFAGESIIGDVL